MQAVSITAATADARHVCVCVCVTYFISSPQAGASICESKSEGVNTVGRLCEKCLNAEETQKVAESQGLLN